MQIPKITEETRLKAATIIAQRLIDEAGVEGNLEEIAADVAKHCRYGDGFQRAKDLESAYWDCDSEMAEVLDDHDREIDRVHEEYLKQWAIDNAIEPPLPVGAKVSTSVGEGIIDKIYEYRPLTYSVKTKDSKPNSSYLFYFDQVTEINQQEVA